MTDLIPMESVLRLAAVSGEPCVSIYMPTHPSGSGTEQDPIRLRNLAAQAAQEVGAAHPLAGIRQLDGDRDFWAHQGHGLAVLVGGGATITYRLPDPVEEIVVVADRLHVTPLLVSAAGNGSFFVLALSRNRVRLLRGIRSSIVERITEGIPASLAEALRFDDREPQMQSHAAQRTGTGRVAAAFHGQGGRKDRVESDTDRFLAAVDTGVRTQVGAAEPLVLGGVADLVAQYRRLTAHARVVAGEITGSLDRAGDEEILARAWPLVRRHFEEEQVAARQRIVDRSVPTMSGLVEVVLAAHDGRVRSLFVPIGRHRWGRFEADQRRIEQHDQRQQGDRDLFDVATGETLLTGGHVIPVAPDDLPGAGPLAAELRF